MANEVGTLLGKPKENKTYAPDARWVLPKTFIGMEFEYEGVDPVKFFNDEVLPTSWNVHPDNSLKDNGAEFVFRQPMFGTDAYNAIVALMTKAQKFGLKCSVRAGIHVHLDVRDMESSQLIGLIILYTILEPLIFRWIGDGRENSIFCVPFYRADESLLETCKIVHSVIQDEKYQSRTTYANAKKFARYAALNLNALYKYGSVEFRHMRTTHDVQRVIDWINIIQSLKAATQKLPTSDGAILRLARNIPANAFLAYVFGDELAKKLWIQDAQDLITNVGVPTARDLVLYGLTEMNWKEISFPKGPHLGFKKFQETSLERKKAAPPEAGPPLDAGEPGDGIHGRAAAGLSFFHNATDAVSGEKFPAVRLGGLWYYLFNSRIYRMPGDWTLEERDEAYNHPRARERNEPLEVRLNRAMEQLNIAPPIAPPQPVERVVINRPAQYRPYDPNREGLPQWNPEPFGGPPGAQAQQQGALQGVNVQGAWIDEPPRLMEDFFRVAADEEPPAGM